MFMNPIQQKISWLSDKICEQFNMEENFFPPDNVEAALKFLYDEYYKNAGPTWNIRETKDYVSIIKEKFDIYI